MPDHPAAPRRATTDDDRRNVTDADDAISLRPPRNRIERRAVIWWALQALALAVPVLAGLVVAYVLWEPARPWLVAPFAIAVLLAVVGLVVEPWWRFRVHRWETTDQAVYALTGWLVLEWRVAPLSRIQTVDAVRGPLEQVLGLATLRVTTASSKGAIAIGGLDHRVAAAEAERLTHLTEATPGDAT